jgi:hypothetical protein
LYEGWVFPNLKHFILTYAPTVSFKCSYDSSGYDTKGTLDRINRQADLFVCDARAAVQQLIKNMSQPPKVDDGDPVGNMMAILKRYRVLVVDRVCNRSLKKIAC